MRFAKWTFRIAGIYGLLVVTPMLFLEQQISQDTPPAITHPEFYYGFVLAVIAWQVVFLIISRNPARYRTMMPAALIEKSYGIATVILFAQDRISPTVLGAGLIDLFLGVLFLAAYLTLRQQGSVAGAAHPARAS